MGRNHKNRIVSEVDPVYEVKSLQLRTLRTAAYARVSTDSSDQENSLKNQKQHYDTTIPKNHNWIYVGLYADDGISGTSIRKRTAFNQMVADCKAGMIDLIVVKDVSRFARNIVDCLNTVELLLTLDPPVGIFFENNNLNTLDTGSKIFLTMFAMFAELESELRSRSVSWGNSQCFEDGNYFCPKLLGYERDGKYGMKIEPEGAKTVRLIYDLFLTGYSTRKIAGIMTSLSLQTAKKKTVWSAGSVAGILKNEKYCGDFLMQKGFNENYRTQKSIRNSGQRKLYYEPDHHDGIVTRDEYARTLLLLKSDQSSPFYNSKYTIEVIRQGLLSGFIPMNTAFGGYSAANYLAALEAAQITPVSFETEVSHIQGARRVRSEFLSNTPAVTLSSRGVSFNAVCIGLMPEVKSVEMLLHPAERLIAIRKSASENAVPWKSKALPAKNLLSVIYPLMGWQNDWQYKITADCFCRGDEMVILFDLDCCEFRFKDDGKTTRAIPSNWISEFGEVLPEHMMLCRRALSKKLSEWETDAVPSAVKGFELGIDILTRKDADRRIEEMRRQRE